MNQSDALGDLFAQADTACGDAFLIAGYNKKIIHTAVYRNLVWIMVSNDFTMDVTADTSK